MAFRAVSARSVQCRPGRPLRRRRPPLRQGSGWTSLREVAVEVSMFGRSGSSSGLVATQG